MPSALRPLRRAPRADRRRALRSGHARHLASRPVHLHARGLRGLRRARATARDAPGGKHGRARLPPRPGSETGRPSRDMLVPPPGTTGIRMLAAAGLLDGRVMAAHCVDVDADEIELLAAHGVGVAHCPRSNGWLGCGVAPVAELTAAGVTVAIATDSPASTPSLDLFEEARTAIVAARGAVGRPDAMIGGRRPGGSDPRRRARAGARRRGRLDRSREARRSRDRRPRRLASSTQLKILLWR